ncbi:MAG: hypothetical protein EP298_06705 [Gammaproteobacteria bacterium]|nr:MAG: hypothetical protein EP298_06705 [Gammaproteobacteria bacterium]UTW42617.1 hypothetical protein KFE69_00260 [bacterium SCSIO 12844]
MTLQTFIQQSVSTLANNQNYFGLYGTNIDELIQNIKAMNLDQDLEQQYIDQTLNGDFSCGDTANYVFNSFTGKNFNTGAVDKPNALEDLNTADLTNHILSVSLGNNHAFAILFKGDDAVILQSNVAGHGNTHYNLKHCIDNAEVFNKQELLDLLEKVNQHDVNAYNRLFMLNEKVADFPDGAKAGLVFSDPHTIQHMDYKHTNTRIVPKVPHVFEMLHQQNPLTLTLNIPKVQVEPNLELETKLAKQYNESLKIDQAMALKERSQSEFDRQYGLVLFQQQATDRADTHNHSQLDL